MEQSKMIERTLQKITNLIVQSCDPQQVILFGSYAKGNPQPTSDLDLLVIGDFRNSRYLRGHELKGLLEQFAIPIDLHLLTQTEFEVESQAPYSFLNNLRKSWILLYQKSI